VILLAIVLLAFGLADIVRDAIGGEDLPGGRWRRFWSALAASFSMSVAAFYVAGRGGFGPWLLSAAIVLAVAGWITEARWLLARPRIQLTVVGASMAVALIVSGSFAPARGDLAHWYRNLPFSITHSVTATQAFLALAAAVFLLNTTNRIVRLVLDSVHADRVKGETKLRGGRYIGAIERIIVAALILAGSADGAGLIIAAKGFIRLPEIRSPGQVQAGLSDEIAEYFLIGTLTSVVIAAGLGLLVLAAR
jgi:hypothetical protein